MIISSTNTVAAINSYDKLLSDDMRVASLNSLTSNAAVTMKVHKCITIRQSDTVNSCSEFMVQQQHEKMRRTLKATFHNATHEGIKLHIQ